MELERMSWYHGLSEAERSDSFLTWRLDTCFDAEGFPKAVGRIDLLPYSPSDDDQRFEFWAWYGSRIAPETLCHYTPIRRATQIVIQRRLLATSLHDLDDPGEMWQGLRIGQAQIDAVLRSRHSPIHESIRGMFNDCIRRDFTSLSLTTDADSDRMWREYGRGKGVMMVFNVRELWRCLPGAEWGLRPCVYAPGEHKRRVQRIIHCFISKAGIPARKIHKKDWESLMALQHMHLGIADALHIVCSFMKAPPYKWEREWRLLCFSEDQELLKGQYSLRRGGRGRARSILIPPDRFSSVIRDIVHSDDCSGARVEALRSALDEVGCRDKLVSRQAWRDAKTPQG